jgi:exonuclease V
MASDKVDYSAIVKRYGLNGVARFSDAFIAQIGNLHDEIFYDADSKIEETPLDVQSPDLIRYRSISQIIPLLKAELKETFPIGSTSLSNLLAVQYRHRDDGRILGNNSFPNDPEAIDVYMKDNLRWWRGEREPEGVAIEEAYKCGWCEFAGTCQWRKDKEVEFLKQKKKGKMKVSEVPPGNSSGPPWP